jgi:predicted MFS family arabinose efflux permease
MSGVSMQTTPLPQSPQARASWTAVAAIGIGAFALVTSEFLPVGLLPQVARELDVSAGQAGLMVTTPGITAAIAAPLTLLFAGRMDRRHVLCFLIALLALSNLTVALAHSFGGVLAGRILLGIAVGGFWTIGGSLGARLRPDAAAKASSLIFAGVSVGTVAGVPIGTLVGNLVGWRMAFAGATAVAVLVLGLLMLVLPAVRPQGSRSLAGIGAVLALPKIRVGLAAIFLLFVGQFGAYTYITPYLLEHKGVLAAAISPILFGYGAAGFAGNLLAGWAAGRSVRGALAGTAALMAAAVLLLTAAATPAQAIVPVLLWGVAFGMMPIAIQTWLFGAAPDHLEAVSAVFSSSGQASIGAGALAGGLVVDHVGLPGAMALGAAGALATLLLVSAWRPGAGKDRD